MALTHGKPRVNQINAIRDDGEDITGANAHVTYTVLDGERVVATNNEYLELDEAAAKAAIALFAKVQAAAEASLAG